MDSIKRCIVERALHEQEIQTWLKRLNERNLQIQECKIQEVKAADASSGDIDISGFITKIGNVLGSENNYSKTGNDQITEKQSSTSGIESSSNATPDSSDMCNNEFKDDQNINDHEDESVMLANLIANLKLDIDEKIIQKQLKKVNDALTHELNECKYALVVSNDIRDRCKSALHQKEVELEK
nr:hypothetical protein [Tanacetum cinerariifolium]